MTLARALDEKDMPEYTEATYIAQNDVRNDLDVKLAMNIMQCQYKMFSKEHFDVNVNSAMSDWIILALSPMGKYLFIYSSLNYGKTNWFLSR